MEGYLDHLETTGLHRKVWESRFFKLNKTFHVLEYFTDETQYERKGKLELRGATVATADELGGLLSEDKTLVEMSRRFIFRITENGSKKHHFLCVNLSGIEAPTYKLASSSRDYLGEWLRALRATIVTAVDPPLSTATMGLGELNTQIGAFMNHMHLSARISNRTPDHGKSIYEITVKAWILARELVMLEGQEEYPGPGEMSWQILEYSCAWKLRKSTAELRNFDGQLRLFLGSSLQNLDFPSNSLGNKLQQLHLHASATQKETENLQRMQEYDAYLQSLLRLPAFSSFGSDASTMLDTFLDISPHLTSFRKLEKEIGQSLYLRDRTVVPWRDRERFQMLYKMHLEVITAQEENARRVQTEQTEALRKKSNASHRHRHSRHHSSDKRNYTQDEEFAPAPVGVYVSPLPAPTKLNTTTEEARPSEVVHDRIARIGHRLVVEAFEA
ncbi:Pleckstrin homology domain-containing protein [Phytophthora infestans]|uniref:PH domain-containing protein n=1 Tax=Phytophthora infestans TaxID=4787 RepID=A0A833T2Z7_PHYIN|nr:Pleckstrin homology domain-containing protein [Phytophthora infestans]KAF4140177.1 PH domain-containing protein [Phytophthora infestans]